MNHIASSIHACSSSLTLNFCWYALTDKMQKKRYHAVSALDIKRSISFLLFNCRSLARRLVERGTMLLKKKELAWQIRDVWRVPDGWKNTMKEKHVQEKWGTQLKTPSSQIREKPSWTFCLCHPWTEMQPHRSHVSCFHPIKPSIK